MILTEEQRAALEWIAEYMSDDANDRKDCELDYSFKILRSMLTQSRPGWEITEERKIALRQIELFLTGSRPNDLHWDLRAIAILKDMLDEVKE